MADQSLASDDTPTVPRGFVAGLFDLTGRVAVVTGGGSGLGQAIALGLSQAGATLVVLDVNEMTGRQTVQEIEHQGGIATWRHCDVTIRTDVECAADWVVETHGRIDVLVNSAGSAFRAPAETFPEERFDFIIDLNLKGTFLCCQAFGRKMLAQRRGAVINLASIGSFVAYPLASAYLASKGGVIQVTRGLALEWRDRGVRVNAIAPTLIETALTRSALEQSSSTADFIKQRMLRDRPGLPRDLVGAAIFLASDASELVTGHVLMCDDGYLIA